MKDLLIDMIKAIVDKPDEVDIAIDLIKKLDIKLMTQTEFMQQVDKIYMTITQEENYED